MSKFILGLSGVAESGKDLFCEMLIDSLYKNGWKAKRFAIADELKENLNPFCKDEFDVDLFDCTKKEKDLVRPMMVAYGKVMRNMSEGTWWTSKLEKRIKEDDCDVAIVTDIRYDVFDKDEVYWLKEHLGGLFVHISRYSVEGGQEMYVLPPNEEERIEDPKMIIAADYMIQWKTCEEEERQDYVNRFLGFANPLIERC